MSAAGSRTPWANFAGLVVALCLFTPRASGAETNQARRMSSDLLAAKTSLEEVLTRRLESDLSTILDKGAYTVSSRIGLIEEKEPQPAQQQPSQAPTERTLVPFDMQLGQLPLPTLLAQQQPQQEKLEKRPAGPRYAISSILVSVGISPELPAETQAKVESFVGKALSAEFGELARYEVFSIQAKPPKPEPEKPKAEPPKPIAEPTWLDRLSQFQLLTGLLAIMLGISAFGAFHWLGMVSSRKVAAALAREDSSRPAELSPPLQPQAQSQPQSMKPSDRAAEPRGPSPDELSRKIREAAKRDFRSESLINQWLEGGEVGQLKLSLFVEAVAEGGPKIQIPPDFRVGLGRVFERASALSGEERADLLQKAYWDLLACQMLGAESIQKPFSYLDQVPETSVQGILIEQNPRMRASIALHMPKPVRQQYLRTVRFEDKQALLGEILRMDGSDTDELKQFDQRLRSELRVELASGGVSRDLPLIRDFLEGMEAEEELLLLQGAGSDLQSRLSLLKHTHPTLAFLPVWTDAMLTTFLAEARPSGIATLIHRFPAMKDRALALLRGVAKEIVTEDLASVASRSESEQRADLESLRQCIQRLVSSGRIDLSQIDSDATVVPIRSDGAGGQSEAA